MINFIFKSLRESDLPMLFDWLGTAHVAQWWRESRDWDIFSKKYRERIRIDDVGQFVVYDQEKPIGFIAWHEVAQDPNRKEQYPDDAYGIDVFIADLDYLGKGYGADLIRQFIKQEIMPMNPSIFVIDPEITNTRAIHVYEKVGFKKVAVSTTTDGTKLVKAQLMELDPKSIL